jgi:hypothetical protein
MSRVCQKMHPDGRRETTKSMAALQACALANMCRQIEYDVKHGAASEQVLSMFHKVRNDKAFSELRKGQGSMERLAEVEDHFTKPKSMELRWH